MTGKLAQVKIGNFPQTSLAAARLKLNELKLLRQEGRCPASELKQEKQLRAIEAEQAKVPELTVQGLVELYLTERIEDRKTKDGKIIPGARKKKGQDEVRRTLYADAVDSLGDRNAAEITRNDVITLINGIVARGAKVQAVTFYGSCLWSTSSLLVWGVLMPALLIPRCWQSPAFVRLESSLPIIVVRVC
ncbi:TPA: DUF4102 domain-containing protein [Kluyvera intermedia]|uniref:DUF4102 domain-containing protein n=1 Tax=Kluyvera intermedia TaxID=61648 RepID=A0A9P3TDG4_KLUIN|nr:DUF4102 domain-containing protein [Kluyvera intermedia]HAT2518187.1 DUF4102 domain-containing protein [Kluyvera intermedia]HAT2606250.1 DUF4102 domain-containing protein [Kluyvera intermedia]HAT2683078.1 DUF4102 domain-containing protein [Kluyvera intermedia]HAT2699607.1 DUF4102 domain-containing protein [Kluyvera intermedia]